MPDIGGLCAALRNYFVVGVHSGTYVVSGGAFPPQTYLQEGQYFRIMGSVFNDGVHRFPCDDLIDEEFDGEVWAMAVPRDAVALAEEVERYNAKVDEMLLVEKGYTMESFGGYSYSLRVGAPAAMLEWAARIRRGMNRWRKI
jgi:hypothetical protein